MLISQWKISTKKSVTKEFQRITQMLTNFYIMTDFVNILSTTKIETDITDLFGNNFQERITL